MMINNGQERGYLVNNACLQKTNMNIQPLFKYVLVNNGWTWIVE